MTKGTDLPAATPSRRQAMIRTTLFGATLLLVVSAVAYFLYYLNRRDYLANRNLRTIATIATRTEENVAAHRQFLKNYAEPVDDEIVPLELAKAELSLARERRMNLAKGSRENPHTGWEQELRWADQDIAFWEKTVADEAAIKNEKLLEREEERDFLYPGFTTIQSVNRSPALLAHGMLTRRGATEDGFAQRVSFIDGSPSLELSYRATDGRVERGAYGRVPLRKMIENARQLDPSGTFEMIFIADATGRILAADAKEHSSARVVGLGQLVERRAFGSASPVAIESLAASTAVRRVTLGGRTYRLFTQPHRNWSFWNDPGGARPTPASAPAPNQRERTEGGPSSAIFIPAPEASASTEEPWIIGGIVPEDEFVSAALAVPSSALLLGLSLGILGILFWPLLRLALIGEAESIRYRDALLAWLCTVGGVALMTLVALDVWFYRGVEKTALRQLESLSDSIVSNLGAELRAARLQLASADEMLSGCPGGTATKRCGNVLTKAPFSVYPIFESIFRIDADGMQAAKWSTHRFATPLVSVRTRGYYDEVVRGRSWRGPEGDYYVESIRSRTTGRPEAVISMRSARDETPVIAMATELVSLVDPLIPPGFSFAVIDERGQVLFHHDTHRNLSENFFVESDDDPRIKAAVYARAKERMDLSYGGKEYRSWVRPIENTPWTLITMRDKAFDRGLNADIVLITASLLAVYLLIAGVAAAIVLLPSLRERWGWPDRARTSEYSRIAAVGVLLLAAFGLSTYALEGDDLLGIAVLYPAVALTAAASVLQSGGRRAGAAATALAAILTAVLVGTLVRGTLDADSGLAGAAVRVAAALLAAGALLLVLVPRRLQLPRLMSFRASVLAAATALLVVGASLPTVAFFKAAARTELDVAIKHAQVELAALHWKRDATVAHDFSKNSGWGREGYQAWRTRLAWDRYYGFFHQTRVAALEGSVGGGGDEGGRDLAVTKLFMPRRSDHAIRTAKLIEDQSAGGFRVWRRKRDSIELVASLNPANGLASQMPAHVIQSTPPRRLFAPNATAPLAGEGVNAIEAGMMGSSPQRSMGAGADEMTSEFRSFFATVTSMSFVLLLPAAAALLLVGFIASRLFLLGFPRPLRGDVALRTEALGPATLLFAGERDATALLDTRYAVRIDLAAVPEPDVASAIQAARQNAAPGGIIVLEGWEPLAGGAALTDALERGTGTTTRMALVTRREPRELAAALDALPHAGRWRRALTRLQWLDVRDGGASEQWCASHDAAAAAPDDIRRLEARDPYLELLIDRIDWTGYGQAEASDRLLEHAEAYYQTLWDGCTSDEKLTLEHFARDGFLNVHARRAIRRLGARGLIRWCPDNPAPHLLNESFGRFILDGVRRSEVSAIAREHAPSIWEAVRLPLFAGIIALLVFFFVTQREVFDATTGLISGIGATLFGIIKIATTIGSRRAAAASAGEGA